MGRAGLAELALRQGDVKEMVLMGKSYQHIIAYMAKEWNMKRKNIERDITIVYKEMRQYFDKNRDEIIVEHTAKYDYIYQTCVDASDMKGAMQAMKQKEAILKLLNDQPLVAIQQNNLNLDLSGMSVEDLKNALNE